MLEVSTVSMPESGSPKPALETGPLSFEVQSWVHVEFSGFKDLEVFTDLPVLG